MAMQVSSSEPTTYANGMQQEWRKIGSYHSKEPITSYDAKIGAYHSKDNGYDGKIGSYDDTYEDAQLLHQCMNMTKRLKKEDDPDYEPTDYSLDGAEAQRPTGQYFQKPIFQCPECVRSYKSPVRMANHYRDKHPDKDYRSGSSSSGYSRYSNQRDKRPYDYSPPRSPRCDQHYPSYSPYDYSHKHTRQYQDRERFTANENTQLVTYHKSASSSSSPPHHSHSNDVPRSVTNNILFSHSIPSTPRTMADTSNTSPIISPANSPSISPPLSPSSASSSSSNSSNALITTQPSITSMPSPPQRSDNKTITVHGRTYECKGIRVSTVIDEIKFVDCLEKNKQRLQLAHIALDQGLISQEEYARKQREFLNAFSFF